MPGTVVFQGPHPHLPQPPPTSPRFSVERRHLRSRGAAAPSQSAGGLSPGAGPAPPPGRPAPAPRPGPAFPHVAAAEGRRLSRSGPASGPAPSAQRVLSAAPGAARLPDAPAPAAAGRAVRVVPGSGPPKCPRGWERPRPRGDGAAGGRGGGRGEEDGG